MTGWNYSAVAPWLRRSIGRLFDVQRVTAAAVSLVVLSLVLPPLYSMIRTSLTQVTQLGEQGGFTLRNYGQVFETAAAAGPFVNSVLYAGGSALLAVILGGLLAWVTERTNTPFRTLSYFIAFSVMATPAMIYSVAWIFLLGKAGPINTTLVQLLHLTGPPLTIYSLFGMVLVEGAQWMPLAFLMLGASFRMMDPSFEEAAAMSHAGPSYTLRRVTMPLLAPSVLAIVILAFIRIIQAFAAPAIIGLPAKITVLTTVVYMSVSSSPADYGLASAYGTTLVALVAILVLFYLRMTAAGYRFQTVTGKGFRPRVMDLGKWKYVMATLLFVYLGVVVLLPLGLLVWISLQPVYTGVSLEALRNITLSNYARVVAYPSAIRSVLNSVILGAAGGTIVMFLTLIIAWIKVRTRSHLRGPLDVLSSVPLIFPGIVLGVALLRLYAVLPLPVYGTLLILLISYVTVTIPYGLRYAHAGILQIHQELEEAAAISGATWWFSFRRIVLPLLLPSLIAGWTFTFLLCIKELAASVMLVTSKTPVVAVVLYDLWSEGATTTLAAFGVIFMAIFGIPAITVYLLMQRQGMLRA